MTEPLVDLEAIARAVENAEEPKPMEQPPLRESEVQTKGPVIIDTVTGLVRSAETNAPIISVAPKESNEREIDLTFIAAGLTAFAAVVALVAIWFAPFTLSQKFALCALDIFILAERLWVELRRSVPKPHEMYSPLEVIPHDTIADTTG